MIPLLCLVIALELLCLVVVASRMLHVLDRIMAAVARAIDDEKHGGR